ncbi:Trp biosynthesis-associated membrane protein [Dermacoccaceae bacterium W4C1]
MSDAGDQGQEQTEPVEQSAALEPAPESASTRPRRWMALLPTALGVVIVLIAAGRTWAHGSEIGGGALGSADTTVSGREAAAGAVGASLVALAALLAALTGGRIVRRIGAIALIGAGLLTAGLSLRVLLDPQASVGQAVAEGTARRGSVEVIASATPWVWAGVIAGIAITLAGVLALAGVRDWGGLSSRYDAPVADGEDPASAERATPQESDWDRLSRGEDPT